MNYEKEQLIFKALSDNNRIKIVEMLSCGELCACHLLRRLNITQPTLSHHIKILSEAGIVNLRKQGSWIYCSLNKKTISAIIEFINKLSCEKDNCCCAIKTNDKGKIT